MYPKTPLLMTVPPCKICGGTDYGFVPHTCDRDGMVFEIICNTCDHEPIELYSIEINTWEPNEKDCGDCQNWNHGCFQGITQKEDCIPKNGFES